MKILCITIISIPVKWHKSIDHIFKYSWKKCRINLIIALGVSRDIQRPRRHVTLCPPPEYASASKKSTWTWLGRMICVKDSRSAAAAFAFCSLSWRKITDRDKKGARELARERRIEIKIAENLIFKVRSRLQWFFGVFGQSTWHLKEKKDYPT